MKQPTGKTSIWKWVVLALATLLALSRIPALLVKTASAPNFDDEASQRFLQERIATDWIVIVIATAVAMTMAYLIWFRRT